MVPDAEFTFYYGRPVVKAAPWSTDIPVYLFLGGLAGASSLVAAGAALTDRPSLRRTERVGALVAISAGMVALVHDLGRPARFANMLRVAKPTSPMSMGTWILSVYGLAAGVAGLGELVRWLVPARRAKGAVGLLEWAAGPAGAAAGLLGVLVATYAAVLLSDTATPSWHEGRREMPFVFAGSAAAAAGGLGLLGAPLAESGPARRMATVGALTEVLMTRRMEHSMGITAEPLHTGLAGQFSTASKACAVLGVSVGALSTRRRALSGVSGVLLLAGSLCTRLAIFEAGQASARDPRYTVVPQRQRLTDASRVAQD